jgi:DNA polymerase III epsilon subunit-like protein
MTQGSWQDFRFLSAVDETTIPEPAVPVRRHQLIRPYLDRYRSRFQANAFRMSMTTGEWSSHLRSEYIPDPTTMSRFDARILLERGEICVVPQVVIRDWSGIDGMMTDTNMSDTIEEQESTDATIIFFDIETGGLETHRPITQIAAIAVDEQLNELDSFEVKIRFDEAKACPDALRRNHYRRSEWKRSAIAPQQAAKSFSRFLRRHASVEVLRSDLTSFRVAQLVSHNSQFDGPFLKAWFEDLGIFLPASYRVFCTLQRAYWYFHENPRVALPDDFRLGTLCEYFGVPLNPGEAHEALADACAALALYRVLRERSNDNEEDSLVCSPGNSRCLRC